MKIALHICCGVCAAGAAERLLGEGHQVLGYFSNSNIYPPEEYYKRLETTRIVADALHLALYEAPYQPEEWLRSVEHLSGEPEGGRRCEPCFQFRLQSTFDFMTEQGCDAFTSTLSISPHKKVTVINKVGFAIGGERFLPYDFKKKDGFKRAGELARMWGLYRQSYCGCQFSMKSIE